MNLYIDNHNYHYEIENLIRAFSHFEKIEVKHNCKDLQKPYVYTYVGEKIIAEVSIDDFYRRKEVNKGEDNELDLALVLYDILCEYYKTKLSWGVLTGVRPTKLYRNFVNENSVEYADKYFYDKLRVSDEKIAMCKKIERNQRDIISMSDERSFSLYVSIPFCPSRCSYCSFVSQSVEKAKFLLDDYIKLLIKEIKFTADIAKKLNLKLLSVYIGGGTPTTLSPKQLEVLLFEIISDFDFSYCKEFTVEAGRPDTVTKEKLKAIKSFPVSRISINPQTFNDEVLQTIGRRHTAEQTIKAFELARECEFDNINMDLIAGLTGESLDSFQQSVDKVCALSPESVTVHTLALKRSSALNQLSDEVKNNLFTADMLSYANSTLSANSYEPYYLYRQSKMLSNLDNTGWAKTGYFSEYNIYMMEEIHTVLACGAGAVSKLKDSNSNYIERIFNFKYPYEYINRFDEMLKRKNRVLSFYEETMARI